MRLHAAVLAALAPLGCGGGEPLRVQAPWAQTIGLASEPTALRRTHAVGQAYDDCANVDAVILAEAGSAGATPVRVHLGWASLDEIVAAPVGGPYTVLSRAWRMGVEVRSPDQHDGETSAPDRETTYDVTESNRILATGGKPSAPPPRDPGHFDFNVFPDVVRLRDDEWPSGPQRAGSSWEREAERTTHARDGTPTKQRVHARWTFLGVERAGAERFAHLRCEGTWSTTGEVLGTEGSRARGDASGRFACAWRIDLRDGYAGRYRVEVDGRGSIRVVDARGGEKTTKLTLTGHVDVDVTPSAQGATAARCPPR